MFHKLYKKPGFNFNANRASTSKSKPVEYHLNKLDFLNRIDENTWVYSPTPINKNKNKNKKYINLSKVKRLKPEVPSWKRVSKELIAARPRNWEELSNKYNDWHFWEETFEDYKKRPDSQYFIDKNIEYYRNLDPDNYQQPYVFEQFEPNTIDMTIFYDYDKQKKYKFVFRDVIDRFKGKNKEVRGHTVLYYDRINNQLGIKKIPLDYKFRRYVPKVGEEPDFYKRKIFYLAIMPHNSKFEYCVVRSRNRWNEQTRYLRYTKDDLLMNNNVDSSNWM